MADHRPKDMWRQSPRPGSPAGSAGSPGAPGRGRRRLAVLFAFLALGGVALGLSTFIGCSKPPVLVSIAVTEYTRYDWPVNPWAEQDAAGLRRHFPQDSAQAKQTQTRNAILTELEQTSRLSKSDQKGRPIVVHFSALGVVRDGEVYALPADAEPGQPATWLRLDELLDPIRKAEGDRLFVLDLRPVVDARLGFPQDDLFEKLGDKLQRFEQAGSLPFSVVVSGTSGTQLCWSPELGRSAFGWFLDRGLAGAADVWNPERKANHRISALEWAGYSRQATSAFTRDLSQPVQLPARYGVEADFQLLALPRTGGPEPASPQKAADYPEWLLNGWRERDRWRQRGDDVRLQRTFRQLETYLLRAEQRFLGGYNAGRIQAELAADIDELQKFRSRHPEVNPPARSLVRYRAGLKRNDSAQAEFDQQFQDAKKALEPVLAEIRALSPKLAEPERMKVVAKIGESFKALREKPLPREAAAAFLCDAAGSAVEWSRDQRIQLSKGLLEVKAPAWVEVLLTHFIADLDDSLLKLWEPHKGIFALLHEAFRAAENAATHDSRADVWIGKELQEVDRLRRQAIVQLLTGKQKEREAAIESLQGCITSYGRIALAAESIGRAWNELDATRIFLAQWAGFLAPDRSRQKQLDDDWTALVGNCRKLTAQLKYTADAPQPNIGELTNTADDLRVRRSRVREQMSGNVAVNASAIDIRQWLAWPHWTADERAGLAARMASSGLDPVNKALRSSPSEPGEVKAPPLNRAEIEADALRRTKQSIDLLTLAGDPKIDDVVNRYEAVTRQTTASGIHDLGLVIETHMRDRLPQRFAATSDPLEGERVGWAVHPFDVPVRNSGDAAKLDPAAQFQALQQVKHIRDLSRTRDQADADALAGTQYAPAEKFANDLRALARDQERSLGKP